MERIAIRDRRPRISLSPSKTGVNALVASCGLRGCPSRSSFRYSARRSTGMGIIEKTETKLPSRAADCDRFRLRDFVESLPADEFETRSAPLDLADVAAALEDNPKAVMFGAVGPERQQLVGNVTGSRARIARAFGVAANDLSNEIRHRLDSKPDVFEIARGEAPAQEIELTGAEAD